MKQNKEYQEIFERYGGIMRTCELTAEGISYKTLQNLINEKRDMGASVLARKAEVM